MPPPPPGEIDGSNYLDLTEVLATAAESGEGRLQADMADVACCDLAGLRAVLSLAAAPGVRLVVLRHLAEPLHAVLQILGWDATPGACLDRPGR